MSHKPSQYDAVENMFPPFFGQAMGILFSEGTVSRTICGTNLLPIVRDPRIRWIHFCLVAFNPP